MKEKTKLELQIEEKLAEWTLQQRIKERFNEYNFQQRVTKGLEILTAIDDDYVRNMAKVMFGEDVELNERQVTDLRPICIEVALEDLEKLYPIID